MKKLLLLAGTLLFLSGGLLILHQGDINDAEPATLNTVKQSVKWVLRKFSSQPALTKKTINPQSADTLLLLLSDISNNPDFVQGWKNIAGEEGLHLTTLTDSEFLALPSIHYVGIILPDSIHKNTSSKLSKKIMDYVAHGGTLMLVYDAATINKSDSSVPHYPLLTDLLGLDCGLKDILKGCSMEVSAVGHTQQALNALGVPPGKCMPSENKSNPSEAAFCSISSSELGVLYYEHYLIKPPDDSPLLLTTPDNQLIANVIPFGQGRVLFINLPLTYLWSQTDAMFLHVFLRYFAGTMLELPSLAAVPNGVGGIIMNLHVESKDALVGFKKLENIGLFKQHPYSIDFSAAPGVFNEDDREGLDVLNNKDTQKWMLYLLKLGNAIGSDGGWLHDYFGLKVSESNQRDFQRYLEINIAAIEDVVGQKVLEYVPSEGNQPSWVTRYLEQHDFLGYYTTSNTGTAPTQNYINGIFDQDTLWSFPVLPFKKGACFRDFGVIGYDVPSVTQWFIDSTNFVATNHTARLLYFHPPDILFFPQYLSSLQSWLALTQQLQKKGVFQWYTMVDLARFLNSRRQVVWQIENRDNTQWLHASHPITLNQQSWIIYKHKCQKPIPIKGAMTIKEDDNHWIVQAGNGQVIEFKCQLTVAARMP